MRKFYLAVIPYYIWILFYFDHHHGFFNSLLCVSRFQPMSVLPIVEPYLGLSRQAVFYHPSIEPLLEVFGQLRTSPGWLNVNIAEYFVRAYQVLPKRTHPENHRVGLSGYILSATKVESVVVTHTAGGDLEGKSNEGEGNQRMVVDGEEEK